MIMALAVTVHHDAAWAVVAEIKTEFTLIRLTPEVAIIVL
jgi:hypothetical protein